MTPPTVNAYYEPTENEIGELVQPRFRSVSSFPQIFMEELAKIKSLKTHVQLTLVNSHSHGTLKKVPSIKSLSYRESISGEILHNNN